MVVQSPPPAIGEPLAVEALDAGVIEEARARQRRHRGIAGALAAAAITALVVASVGGGGNGASGPMHPTSDSWSRAVLSSGLTISYPAGWHLITPPITRLAYPIDRLLLTNYPARAGGACAPSDAGQALPAEGVLVYMIEWLSGTGSFGSPPGAVFPSEPARTVLGRKAAYYECWGSKPVSTHLLRFSAAGRHFQVEVALGPHVTSAARRQLLLILDRFQFRTLTASAASTRTR